MKIISKYKDYYDYLQGIYGIDEKLVLDRTVYHNFNISEYKNVYSSLVRFYVCDYVVEGIYDYKTKKFLYGKDIEWQKPVTKRDMSDCEYYIIPREGIRNTSIMVLTKPVLYRDIGTVKYKPHTPNEIFNCPILKDRYPVDNEYDKSLYDLNPILSQYSFQSVFSPEKIWTMLSEWLGNRMVKPTRHIQTNNEKILSHGFDLKTSFRKLLNL